MQSIIVIGASGQGKTFFAKKNFVFPDKPCLVFDINNEYDTDRRNTDPKTKSITDPQLAIWQPDKDYVRSRYIGGDMDEFTEIAVKKRNTNIIFDEASIFFDGRITEANAKKIILTRRHGFNNVILCFHSVEEVPRFMYRQSNFIVLFKTQDTEKAFTNKADFLKPYFLKLQKSQDHTKIIIPRN